MSRPRRSRPSRRSRLHRLRRPRPSRAAVRTIAWLTAIGGVLLIAARLPWFHQRFVPWGDAIAPYWARVTGHVVGVIVGLVLLYVADQLARRKHRAWQLATGLFVVSLGFDLVKEHPIAAAYSTLVLVLLVDVPETVQRTLRPAIGAAAAPCGAAVPRGRVRVRVRRAAARA